MAKINKYLLSIADIYICIKKDHDLIINDAFLGFLESQEKKERLPEATWLFQFCEVSGLQIPAGRLIFETGEYSVFMTDNHEYVRVFRERNSEKPPYAISVMDVDNKSTEIFYLSFGEECVSEMRNCFFHTSWEKVMSIYGRVIFHSACIRTSSGGVLFSGPSGIGKSTQADLWIKHENAELINGDRTILYTDEEGNWLASGSPYAGSSKCYKNEQCQVKAIVMLKQAQTCSIRRLSRAESFRKIYQQCTVYSWDNDFIGKVCDLIEKICIQIPVYELSCNISKEAVYTLKKELEAE